MTRRADKGYTLYLDILWQQETCVPCSDCRKPTRAERMIWIKLHEPAGYVALCSACYPAYVHTAAVPVAPDPETGQRPLRIMPAAVP